MSLWFNLIVMTYLNGIFIVFLFAGGGLFFASSIRRRDASAIALSAALMALGLAEVFEIILSVEFYVFSLKSWYFLTKIVFWGLLGTGIVLKVEISPSLKWKISGSVLLGLLAGLALLLLTQITAAVDWFAPDQSVFVQYVDLMARNRPLRWLTSLFAVYGVGFPLGFAGYALFARRSQRVAYLAASLGSLLLAGQEIIYNRAGEGLGDRTHLLGGAILFLAIWSLFQGLEPMPAPRSKFAHILSWIAVIAILVIGARIRLNAYGNICEALLTSDSAKFIALSGENVFSSDFLASNRPAFITLAYKLGGVDPEMLITEFSKPERLIPRQVYADLNCISGLQAAMSILSWSVLSVVLASKLRSNWLRVVIAALVLGFAYVPQLADWDRVIQSESLSFSMWALTFAMSIEFVARILRDKKAIRWSTWLFFVLWGLMLVSWGFSRDTNIYMILLIGVSSALALLIPAARKNMPVPLLLTVALFCLAVFGLQNSLLYRSDRWMNSFFNNLNMRILPYPEREAWFVERGLPTPKPLYQYANLLGGGYEIESSELDELLVWTAENGSGLYTKYLLTHPAWAINHAWKVARIPFIENLQPYSKPDFEFVSPYLYSIGDMLHPKTSVVAWVQWVMLLGWAGLVVFKPFKQHQRGILIVFGLFFVGELGMLFVSIHGDALGLIRHALVSVMPLRLNLWLLSVWLLDGSLYGEVSINEPPRLL